MDKLILKDCRFLCRLGETEWERARDQEIFIDLETEFDIGQSARSDNLRETVDYDELHADMKTTIEKREYKLIESMAEEVAKSLLQNFPVQQVRIVLKKPKAHLGVAYAAVDITRHV